METVCDKCGAEDDSDCMFTPSEKDGAEWADWIGTCLCNECQGEITLKAKEKEV